MRRRVALVVTAADVQVSARSRPTSAGTRLVFRVDAEHQRWADVDEEDLRLSGDGTRAPRRLVPSQNMLILNSNGVVGGGLTMRVCINKRSQNQSNCVWVGMAAPVPPV